MMEFNKENVSISIEILKMLLESKREFIGDIIREEDWIENVGAEATECKRLKRCIEYLEKEMDYIEE